MLVTQYLAKDLFSRVIEMIELCFHHGLLEG